MQGLRAISGAWRAVMVAAILYGVLVQAFMAAATPVLAQDAGILCSHEDGSVPGSAGHDHPCCTLAHPAGWAPPPAPLSLAVPFRPIVPVALSRPEAVQPRTGPPTHAQSARGPPAA